MQKITVKFGGSSLADAGQFRKVADIVTADPRRAFVVVSAPGRRFTDDAKVTDLLYEAHRLAGTPDFPTVWAMIAERFAAIVRELALDVDLGLDAIAKAIDAGAGRDLCASRGEYLNAKIMAALLGRPFIDAADCVFFRADGTFDAARTDEALGAAL